MLRCVGAFTLLVGLAGGACQVTPAEETSAQPVPVLRVRGAQFVDQAGSVYIPRWVSGLTLLVRPPEQQAVFLDWAADTGFSGVRVFAGALTWAGQTAEGARAALPALLDRAAARGLAVEVTAITDSGSGYDARSHLEGVAEILAGRPGVVLELANEVGNPTQAADLTPARLRAWGGELAAPRGLTWAVGAAGTDELVDGGYPTSGGSYITAHLDRGGRMWPQIARLRSLYRIAETLGVPVLDNEPMGADERPGSETGRQRWNEPAAFFALGALDRAFGLGGVHHSQAGLMAELPGPVQQRCAEAYIAGHRAVDGTLGAGRARFFDAGEAGSPVASIDRARLTAAYSFTAGDRGVTILLGAEASGGDTHALQWASGWRQASVIATMRAADGISVDVVEIVRQQE